MINFVIKQIYIYKATFLEYAVNKNLSIMQGVTGKCMSRSVNNTTPRSKFDDSGGPDINFSLFRE